MADLEAMTADGAEAFESAWSKLSKKTADSVAHRYDYLLAMAKKAGA